MRDGPTWNTIASESPCGNQDREATSIDPPDREGAGGEQKYGAQIWKGKMSNDIEDRNVYADYCEPCGGQTPQEHRSRYVIDGVCEVRKCLSCHRFLAPDGKKWEPKFDPPQQ